MKTKTETAETERSPIDAHVVALNETMNYNIKPEHRRFIRQIRGIYVYDRNEHTHCCELTPSYWLIHINDDVLFTAAGQKLSAAAQDEIYLEYEYCGSEDIYVHCSNIDAIKGRTRHYAYGATGVSYDKVPHDEQMEALREHFAGNSVL